MSSNSESAETKDLGEARLPWEAIGQQDPKPSQQMAQLVEKRLKGTGFFPVSENNPEVK